MVVRPRIFIGTADTSSCLTGLSKGFRNLGCSVTTMVTARTIYQPDDTYDVVRGRELEKIFDYPTWPRLLRAPFSRTDLALSFVLNGMFTPKYLEHDVFVFIYEPWWPCSVLFPLLARLNKRIIVYYLGSDVRDLNALSQEYGIAIDGWGQDFLRYPLNKKVTRLRYGELFADTVYSLPDQAGLQIRPYFHARIPLDVLDDLEPHIPARRVPRILHAPSRKDIKGTSHVLAALDTLRREGVEFEFTLLTGVKRDVILSELRDSDIVVDQLLLAGPAVLAAEALASGCAVATRVLNPEIGLPNGPICDLQLDNIVDRLRRLITDVPHRVRLAEQGVQWARDTFSPTNVASRILENLESSRTPDYVPDFYLKHYRLAKGHRLGKKARQMSTSVLERFRPDAKEYVPDAIARGLLAPSHHERRR